MISTGGVQVTAANTYNSCNNSLLARHKEVNLNKNKMFGTCRNYKHLDDQWTFDCDMIESISSRNTVEGAW